MARGITKPTWTVVLVGVVVVGGTVIVGLSDHHAFPAFGPMTEALTSVMIDPMSTNSSMTTPPSSQTPADVNYRLPKTLKPFHYHVTLLPVIEEGNFTADGHVTIELTCLEETDWVVLHINDMVVKAETIMIEGPAMKSSPGGFYTVYDAVTQFLQIRLPRKMEQNLKYNVSMSYTANVNDLMAGLYRSSYTSQEGEKRYLAATQFQPTDARRAFPCFDEPNLKAKFSLTLGRKKTMTSISNVPILRTEIIPEKPDYVWDIYQESVPMSTYLFAFAISDFTKNIAPDAGETKVAVWSKPGTENQTAYACSITSNILLFLEDFFDIKYPLPKQDMIALPDFSAGAMENWGLITYRESLVLYKPGVSSARNKQLVAVVIAHELAHQWFGNLVTTEWWSLVWLNEGFASYMEYKGVSSVEPDMRMDEQFLSEAFVNAMESDSLDSSRPMIMDVNNPEEVLGLFDSVTYEKKLIVLLGPSILRMAEDFLSLRVMREGLTEYLKDRSYDTATSDILWKFLDEAAYKHSVDLDGRTVKEILDTWTLQKNFPVVIVRRGADRSNLVVSQKRFTAIPYENSEEYYWYIPLTFTQNFEERPSIIRRWLPNTNATRTFSAVLTEPDSWVICNYKVFGFYRVNYDKYNWDLILAQLSADHTKIGLMNRAQIIDDTMNLASAGHVHYSLPLEVTRYLRKETEYVPWRIAEKNFEKLSNLLAGTEVEPLLKKYIQTLVVPLYNNVGFEEKPTDKHLDLLLRSSAVSLACGGEYRDCVVKAKSKFDAWRANPMNTRSISPDLKKTVLCTIVRRGDVAVFDFLVKRYNESIVSSEKEEMLSAMTCTRDFILLRRLLKWTILPGSVIRKQDAYTVYADLAVNAVGRSIGFGFVQDSWEQIKEYNGGYSTGVYWIQALTKYFNKQSELEELKALRDEKAPQLGTTLNLDQAIEKTQGNINWVAQYYDVITAWLNSNVPAIA